MAVFNIMKNILLCFAEETKDEKFNACIQSFEKDGFEIHVFNGINENSIKPHNVLNVMDVFFEDDIEENRFYFLSNIKELFILTYKLYNRVFSNFIYYESSEVRYNVQLDEIYLNLLINKKIDYKISKNIFITSNENPFIDDICGENVKKLEDTKEILIEAKEDKFQRYYYFKDKYYMFEPYDGEKNIIRLDNGSKNEKINYYNTIFINSNFALDKFIEALKNISKSTKCFMENYEAFFKLATDIKDEYFKLKHFQKKFYIKQLESLTVSFDEYVYIFVNSIIMRMNRSNTYINNILKCAINSRKLSCNEKYFIFYQLIRLEFLNESKGDSTTSILLRKLYSNILKGFKEIIPYKLKRIYKNERNKDFVIVTVSQFLSLGHGPTKTALDRCYTLIKSMNKRAILINTKDMLTYKGVIPFYDISPPNILNEYDGDKEFQYKDCKMKFYQCRGIMPDLNEIINIIDFVNKEKPYFILNIGGGNIISDLCSKIVPVITEATVMGIPITESQFALMGKRKTEEDINLLKVLGKTNEHAIESNFTFAFKEQSKHYTREDLKLPQDKFLILIVGVRLDLEITEEFIEALKDAVNYGGHFVFAGYFSKYYEIIKRNQLFSKHSTFLGFQEDMLAVCEVCDLYVNPPRVGGQTSAAEAMYKGLPVISLNYGDTAVCAGEEFCSSNLKEMADNLVKFIKDKNYYKFMSEKAKNRANMLLDTQAELKRNLEIIENSKLFF
ncbi:flavodoxin [Clostridium acetobutylicum]|nr:flavodoxin [Clostridium acetobutylicum]